MTTALVAADPMALVVRDCVRCATRLVLARHDDDDLFTIAQLRGEVENVIERELDAPDFHRLARSLCVGVGRREHGGIGRPPMLFRKAVAS